jgi:pyrimidine deaminase RibD-like protein
MSAACWFATGGSSGAAGPSRAAAPCRGDGTGTGGRGRTGATAYVTLEPCAHVSTRGPACTDLLIAAGIARIVAAMGDPDPRTDGIGFARARAAGIAVTTGVREAEARA